MTQQQPRRLIDTLREFLLTAQGKEVSLTYLRQELKLDPTGPAWQSIRKLLSVDLTTEGLVKPSGRSDGIYKVIAQVKPVKVFGRERKPRIGFNFPLSFGDGGETTELCFAKDICFREGDLVLISGRSNFGKTTIILNLCGQNIFDHPILMGNEYTTIDGEPTPRFMARMDKMDWIPWANTETGEDNFTLLPVRDDYAEHIVPHANNFIDWINLPDGEYYKISKVMEDIKRANPRVAVVAIQKGKNAEAGRGGQFTQDFADVEILLDEYGEHEVLMTLGKVKESFCRISGRSFAFGIEDGVRITYFREVHPCGCNKGWRGTKKCESCNGSGWKE